MLEKGDKVRFIDEALGGTITSLIGKDKAEVLTSDGFSTIALLTELVKVNAEKEKQSSEFGVLSSEFGVTRSELSQSNEISGVTQNTKHKTQNSLKVFQFDESNLKEEIVYAAFELIGTPRTYPCTRASAGTSAVQLHIINNTGFIIAFSLSRKFEMRDEGIAVDKMEARSFKSFLTYTQDELKLFESFRIQIIFHPTSKTTFKSPVQKQFRFNADDLLESQDFILGKTNCLFLQLADLKQAPEVDITALMNRFSESSKEEAATAKSSRIKSGTRTVIYTEEKIVDLHIEELLKDFSSMSNGQIIVHQLKHFQYEMDQAMVNDLRKITFIHGVGAGVLRSAIREELKKYPNIKFGDAPSEKFGYGATEIIFS